LRISYDPNLSDVDAGEAAGAGPTTKASGTVIDLGLVDGLTPRVGRFISGVKVS